MTPEQKDFLALVPTGELCEEIKSRFEHCILAGMSSRPTGDAADDLQYILVHTYSGAPFLCVSLAQLVIHKCQHDITGSVREMNIDDL